MAFWKKCGLVTFHGPMLGVDMADKFEPFSEDFFWRTLTSKEKLGKVSLPQDALPKSFFPGKATGRLLGGNLSLLVSILGTPYQPNFDGTVLFIEENGEEPYRVDRMIMQLRNASVFSKTNAVLAGEFTDCIPEDPSKPSFSVEDILRESASSAAKPFLANMPFGHGRRKMTLPVGLKVRVDAASQMVEYLEPAVLATSLLTILQNNFNF
jgi:muramoyltetrapeptide carboxypeptidase